MGNLSTTSTSVQSSSNEEKKFHSFEEIQKGVKSLDLNIDEKKKHRHRFSESNINKNKQMDNYRNVYFQKLQQGNKKENEIRTNMRNSLRISSNHLSPHANFPFDERASVNSNFYSSFDGKPTNIKFVDESFDQISDSPFDTPKKISDADEIKNR
jgi:hypothetical protein